MNKKIIKLSRRLFELFPQYNAIILGQKTYNEDITIGEIDVFNSLYDEIINNSVMNNALVLNGNDEITNILLSITKNLNLDVFKSCSIGNSYLIYIDRTFEIKLSKEFPFEF